MADSSQSEPKAAEQPSHEPTQAIVPDDNPNSEEELPFVTESDVATSTQSLSSSIVNYQYENGRRYHAYREGEYVLPNDDREQDRLDLLHHIFRLSVGGALFRAPTDPSSARILDIGTGTGIWAIEMADEFPRATVTGTDLSPIQPRWVPPNCYFEVDDFESDWEFSKKFDFIHGRALAGSVKDWEALFKRIHNNLNPGGWVELADFPTEFFSDDDTLKDAPNVMEWVRLQNETAVTFGKLMNVAHLYKQWMIDAGFKDVKEEIVKVPTNPWAKDKKLKELGRYEQANVIECMEAYSLALFTRVLGWTHEATQVFFAGVRKELVDRSIHLYAKFYFVYGRKEE